MHRRSALSAVSACLLLAACGTDAPDADGAAEPPDLEELASAACDEEDEESEFWIVDVEVGRGGADTAEAALEQLAGSDSLSVPDGEPVRLPGPGGKFVYVDDGRYAGSVTVIEHEGDWFPEQAEICR